MFLGKKWLEKKFTESLEEFKHEQQKELEDTRYKIYYLFNRVLKIQEKEFDVLSTAWEKMQDVNELVSSLVSVLQQYPDLNNRSEQIVREILDGQKWHDLHIEELLKSSDRNKYYQDKIFWYRLTDVKKSFMNFRDYISRNRIFLRKDLKDLFVKAGDKGVEKLSSEASLC